MSQLDKLISELCTEDIEFKELGDIGTIFGGLTGKSKTDFSNGNARYISYVNVFKNIAVNVEADDFVKIAAGERQRELQWGDILFTGSSETAEEVCMSSVVTAEVQSPLYLNSFCIAFRPNDVRQLQPDFAKYLFRSEEMRKQLIRTASGVTRFNVSKARLAKVRVPILPLKVQREIARFLDRFTSLTTNLTSELTSELSRRKAQYAYYRDRLLSFDKTEVEWVPLGEIGEFIRGKRFTKDDYAEDGIDAIHYGEIYTRYGTWTNQAFTRLRSDMVKSLRYAEPGDVVLAGVGETVEDVGKAVAWLGTGEVAIHDDSYAFRHAMNPKYLSYALQTSRFIEAKAKHVSRGKVNRLSASGLAKVRVPIPFPSDLGKSLKEQARIVGILDKFDALTNSLSDELPRETELRRKQYEHYRDLLLTFPKPFEARA